MKKIKIGKIPFLNTKPIFFGIEANGGKDLFDVESNDPAENIELLIEKKLDLAVVPSVEYARCEGLKIIPDISISSHGPVASVNLFCNKEISNVKTIAVDGRSRTSIALLQILCAEKFEIAPELIHIEDITDCDLSEYDAFLIIGDEALHYTGEYKEKIDLGEQWTEFTSYPFVYAFIAGWEENLSREHLEVLASSLKTGLANIQKIAENHCNPKLKTAVEVNEKYLTENIFYTLGEKELDGLKLFFIKAWEHGIIQGVPRIQFLKV